MMPSNAEGSHELPHHNPNRPHSFDLTLELEHQLDNDSLPSPRDARPQSLDPHVLAAIVTSLRMNLADTTRDRDGLQTALDTCQAREQKSSSELRQAMETQAVMQEELAQAKKKIRDDEESISMLRSKVEESRRGLMRLQTQSRRTSQASNMSLDLSRASVPFGPPSSKRASFTPLTGSGVPLSAHGHRRISSVSDSGARTSVAQGDHSLSPASPTAQLASFPDMDGSPSSIPKRLSGLFGRMAPSEHIDSSTKIHTEKVESLQREIRTLRDALEEVRHELTEAIEAREASETCVRALREFIAENNVGMVRDGVQSPTTPQAADPDRKRNQGGSMTGLWGLKLWRAEHGRSAGSGAEMGLPSSSVHTGSTPVSSETLTKKFGGFFVARQQQTQAREPLQSGSDASSVADSVEPVSPASEKPDTGLLPDLAGTSSSDVERTTDAMKGMDQSDIRVVAL